MDTLPPLHGVTVVDLSRALAGPYCTALLADLGAEVIKVESRKSGDVTRQWPPFEGEYSLYFESTNRNKRSIALDFYSEAGQQVLHDLLATADVLVENFRPGVMDKMGLGYDSLRERYPDLIIGSVTGFGTKGPLKDAAGLDQVAQGMSGLMSITGPDREHPYRFGVPIIDMVSGIFTAVGIAASLAGRAHTRGAHVTTSLLESAMSLAAFQGQKHLSTGAVPEPNGNEHASITPYGAYQTADTPLIIAVGSEGQWRSLAELIGAPQLVDDPRFLTGRDRSTHRDDLRILMEQRLVERDAKTWMEMIRAAGIPCGPIYDYAQAFQDEQVKALGIVQEMTRRDGTRLPLVRGPLSIDGEATPVHTTPPLLGQDSRAVLTRLGYDDAQVEQLMQDGVIVEPGTH